MLLLLTQLALAADCPSTPEQVEQAIDAAHTSFAEMKLVAFGSDTADARTVLECVDAPMPPAIVASYHGLVGLAAFVDEDGDRTARALASARAVESGFVIPETVAPEGHPLTVMLEAASAWEEGQTESVATGKLSVWVDGFEGLARPLERPVVLQQVDRKGVVLHTLWLDAGEPLPEWAVAVDDDAGGRQSKLPAVVLGSVAAGAAIGAGALYGSAWAGRGRYLDDATPFEDLSVVRKRTNTRVNLAAACGGVALGAGVGTLVVAW